jgi:DNA replication licensing factor MCM5
MNSKKSDRGAVGVRAPYMRVIGIEVETDGVGRASRDLRFTPDEEEEFRRLAAKPDVHSIIAR